MTGFPRKLPAMTRRAITILALSCALSVGAPALASAASSGTPAEAIRDCYAHERLTTSYSSQALREALAQMPADVKEYSDCYDVIERQLFRELGGVAPGSATAPGSNSGSSFVPTWLIIVIAVLALAAITFGSIAIRRRSGGPGEPPGAS